MGKSSLECTLLFLLFAALCLEAAVLQKNFNVVHRQMSWSDARAYCQKNHVDLVTWDMVDGELLSKTGDSPVWIGLDRDPANESVWKWIDFETGMVPTEDDLSNSSNWLSGDQSRVCAFTKKDRLWYTDLCSRSHNACCLRGTYYFSLNGSFTWDQAAQACAIADASLVVYIDMTDMYFYYFGWIGMYQVAGNNWMWIGELSPTYTNWAPGEPSPPDCGCFDRRTGKWCREVCSHNLPFVCSDDNLLVVNESKTWEEALDYCSRMKSQCTDSSQSCVYRYQLLSLQDPSDYSYVRGRMDAVTTDEVWIGLRFLGYGWWWLNGQVLDQQGCPSQMNHCGTISKSGIDTWRARDCLEKRNFICVKYKSNVT